MVQNIVLRDLTSPPIKGATTPLISTVLVQRDGTRGGTEEPGDPPPVGEQGTVIRDGLSFQDPRFSGEGANLPVIPGRVSTGTADPLFTFDKVEYLGSFKMGGLNDDRTDTEFRSVAFNPPNGSNGTYGSLFCGYTRLDLHITENQIPDTLSTSDDVNVFPRATQMQGIFSIIDAPKTLNPLSSGMNVMGWMEVINGRLYVNTLDSYSDSGTETPYKCIVFETPSNLAGSVIHGAFDITPNDGGFSDMFSTYMFPIPASKQSIFNGNTHIMGNMIGASITGRLSRGPSVRAVSPGNWNLTVSTQSAGTTYANYGLEDLENYTQRNDAVKNYYDALIGINWSSWIKVPKGATGVQSDSDRTETVELTMAIGPQSSTRQGVALPNYGAYEPTIVVQNQAQTVTYTIGVDYTVEVSQRDSAGYGFNNIFGTTVIVKTSGSAINDGDIVSITYTYLSQRFNDLTYYTTPAETLTDDAGTELTDVYGGILIPNTDTIMFLGKVAGLRYGTDYKSGEVQLLQAPSPGLNARDYRDYDDYYWLMNINDIASAPDVGSVPIYQYGIFDENRWRDGMLNWQIANSGAERGGTLSSCAYDPATKRLYVVHGQIQEAANVNNSIRAQIVSVYLLNF